MVRSSPGEKECAPWLPIFMVVPAILGFCGKYQRQEGITSQSSKLQEQDKLQESWSEVVFICVDFFLPVILCETYFS